MEKKCPSLTRSAADVIVAERGCRSLAAGRGVEEGRLVDRCIYDLCPNFPVLINAVRSSAELALEKTGWRGGVSCGIYDSAL
jgi:hypothetical protein